MKDGGLNQFAIQILAGTNRKPTNCTTRPTSLHIAPHCGCESHIAPHCSTLLHIAPHRFTSLHFAPNCFTLLHIAGPNPLHFLDPARKLSWSFLRNFTQISVEKMRDFIYRSGRAREVPPKVVFSILSTILICHLNNFYVDRVTS